MEKTSGVQSEPLPTGIFKLPGEPAIIVNGAPDEPLSINTIPLEIPPCNATPNSTVDAESSRNAGFGVWLVGREVRKIFENKYYSGTVISFDSENKWYNVEYEDGDSEDLDWHELTEVLLPLDITVPLKSLAQKVIKVSYRKSKGCKAKRIKARGESSLAK